MAFDFDVIGWEDYEGNRHIATKAELEVNPDAGKPTDITDTYGVYVHAYDPETGEHQYFWTFSYYDLDEWEDWLDQIGEAMDMCGMEVAS